MGLDMYVYCISKMELNNPTFLISKEELDQLDKETFSKVVCSNRCEEGKYYLFTENHMKLLLNLCKEILNDSSKECVLLPLSNLDDEEYLMWAEHTYNSLKGIIKSADFKKHIFLYWAGW